MPDFKLLLESINADSLSRLRWRVLREFGYLPNSRDAQDLSNAELILCGLNLCLDHIAIASVTNAATTNGKSTYDFNPTFDYSRFTELGGD